MALNPKMVIAPSLQELFRDEETGLPLRSGYVNFYKDNDRNIRKTVYKLSGFPPNYSFVALANPVQLTGIGSFSDDAGNDIIPYYFPYQGTPNTTDGTVELYYIVVTDEDGNVQFTREGWPNIPTSGTDEVEEFINFIPNGQFLIHTDIPASNDGTYVAGQIRSDVTTLAQGGWTFVRGPGATSTDFVTFEEIEGAVVKPTANPKYEIRIKTTAFAGGGTAKDLRIKFNDVNKFASATQHYTFYFEGRSNTGSSVSVQPYLIKNFGSGGSTESSPTIGNPIVLGTSFGSHEVSFPFGVNIGETIGPGDYVEIALRFPTSNIFDSSLTNFVLTLGEIIISEFPPETDADMRDRSISGWMPTPNPDGSDLYLMPILTKEGMQFDRTKIGKIEAASYDFVQGSAKDPAQLLCDGNNYLYEGHADNGIPYKRLGDYIWDSTNKNYKWGNGASYLSSQVFSNPTNTVRITTNKVGSTTVINPQTSTLTVATLHTGSDYGMYAYKYNVTAIFCVGGVIGAATLPTAGNSGFTVVSSIDIAGTYQTFYVVTTAASAITAGHYWLFSNTTTNYYMWFTIDGSGSDPAIGGRTGIRVDLLSTYTADDVSNVVREALSGWQQSTVVAKAASSISSGFYFTVSANSGSEVAWNVYFVKDNIVGSIPSGNNNIRVDISTGQTDVQVADAIRVALNKKYYAVPDLRGMFLRGKDYTAGWDLDSAIRFSNTSFLYGNNVGTYEYWQNLTHIHDVGSESKTTATNSFGAYDFQILVGAGGTGNIPAGTETKAEPLSYIPTMSTTTTTTISPSGGSQSNPINAYVDWVINF